MKDDSLILAVDGGGTASQAALYSEGGEVLKAATVGPLSRKSSGEDVVLGSLLELRQFVGSESSKVRCAVLGLSGLDSPEDFFAMEKAMSHAGICGEGAKSRKHSYGRKCESAWGFPVLLCSDALLPLFANGFSKGCVLISGTGSVALRIAEDGKVSRFGGWGYRTSDEGSGYWVGCELVREALHVSDELLCGKSPRASLPSSSKSLVEEAFQATRKHGGSRVPKSADVDRKARFLQEWAISHDDPKDYSALARTVIESRGSCCRGIRKRAAGRLAWLASLAVVQDAPTVVLSGGLFLNPSFAEQVACAIAEECDVDGLVVVANEMPATFGAFKLAGHVWPLKPDVPKASNANVRKSMQGNKATDTKPEMTVRSRLREAGLSGYRLHWKAPGRPDVAWPSKKVCIMINGCFWHRHAGCSKATMPKSNTEYWIAKFDRNVERDAENVAKLEADGWRVHVVWECELDPSRVDETFDKLLPLLRSELGKQA